MKRLELLIDECRESTENEEYGTTLGIKQSEFIRAFNNAQESLQTSICKTYQKVFHGFSFKDVVANQDEYDLPADIFMDNRIMAIWFSDTGRSDNYQRLDAASLEEKSFSVNRVPYSFIRVAGKVLLSPVPTISVTNGMKIAYTKKLSTLDIRRAKVLSVTTVGSAITSLFVDTTAYLDHTTLMQVYYACVVDKHGDRKMKALPIENINTATGEVTLDTFSFETGESIAAGDFLVSGKYACNKAELPDLCEKYLVEYTNWKMLRRDSNSDAQEQYVELQKIEDDIVSAFAAVDETVKDIPITNWSVFEGEE